MATANAVVGALRVELGLDSANFDVGLKKSKADLSGWQKGVNSALAEVEAGFKSTASQSGILGSALSSAGVAGVAAGAALAGVAIAIAEARKAFTFADDIADTANRLSISTKALQEYRFAVHDLGGEYGDADTALEGFSKAFGNATAGINKKALKPFQALGLDPKSFATTEDALAAVIDKISNLSSTAEQAAIADKLGLGPMLPALRAGAGAIDDARAAAERLGFVMDDALVQKGGEANDRMEDLGKVFEVQKNSILVELAPAILTLGQGMVDAAKGVNTLFHALEGLNKWIPGKDLKKAFDMASSAGAFGPTGVLLSGLKGLGQADSGKSPGPVAAPAKPKGDGHTVPPPDPGAAKKAQQVDKASQAAVDKATKDELAARTALVGDLQQLAAMKAKEVDQETSAENLRLQAAAANGSITKAAAATAIALNNQTAAEQKLLIQQDLERKLGDQQLAQRQAIGSYYDRIASITAAMAGTAAERNAIEAKNLADQQRLDRDALANRQANDKASSDNAKAAERAALSDLQAVETLQQQHEAQVRLAEEATQRAQAASQLQIDMQTSLLDLARSSAARRVIEAKILDLQQAQEKALLQSVTVANGASQADEDAAKARLGQIDQIHANQKKALALDRSYDDGRNAIDDMARAFKDQDWNGALKGLLGAFDTLKQAFSAAGTIADKVGAITGIAQAAGQAIGGTAGKAISGAASGAMAGFQIGGPVGGLIGGALGGISSLLGSNKAKRAARQAQEQADAQEKLNAINAEAERIQDIATTKRQLEIDLMQETGDAAGALAAQRADELGAMDESLRGLQLQVYAAQDAAAAAENLAKVQEDGAEKVSSARDELSDAYDRESSALQNTITNLGQVSKSLRDYNKSLAAGSAGDLSPAGMLTAAAAAFQQAVAANDNGGLQAASEDYLKALTDNAPDAMALAKGVAQVRAAIEASADAADDQASLAQQQLDALNDQVGGLIEINKSVMTVAQAIDNLAAVSTAAAAANIAAAVPQTPVIPNITPSPNDEAKRPTDFSAYVDQNADLLALYNSGTGMARGRSKEEFGQYHFANFGKAEGRLGPPGFATGGFGKIGGFGGVDSKLVQMRATPGEMVSVGHVDPFDAINGLKAEIAALRGDLVAGQGAIATNTRKAASVLDRWNDEGLPPERDAA